MDNMKLFCAAFAAAALLHVGHTADAGTVTFEPAAGVLTSTTWTEAGMVATFFSGQMDTLSENLVAGVGTGGSFGLLSGGDGRGPGHPNSDVLFSVPGSAFTLTSLDFSGGGDTLLKGFDTHGNQVTGIILTGLPAHIVLDSTWQNLGVVDYCSYCLTTFGNINAIDNLAFDVIAAGTPVPAALPLFASGVGIAGLLLRRRSGRRFNRS